MKGFNSNELLTTFTDPNGNKSLSTLFETIPAICELVVYTSYLHNIIYNI